MALLKGNLQLQWPFEVETLTLVTVPSGITGNLTAFLDYDADCPDQADTLCDDEFQIDVDPGNECYFSGLYVMNITFKCRDSHLNDCPIQTSDNNFASTVSLDVVSQHLCADLQIDVGLTGEMASYEDIDLTIPRDDFFVNTSIFFGVNLTTTDDNIAIATTEVLDVYVTSPILGPNIAKIFYQSTLNPPTTPDGVIAAFVLHNEGVDTAKFEYKIDQLDFGMNDDTNDVVTTYCRLTVTYEGMSSRRSVTMRSADAAERTITRQEDTVDLPDSTGFAMSSKEVLLVNPGDDGPTTTNPTTVNQGGMVDAGHKPSSFLF